MKKCKVQENRAELEKLKDEMSTYRDFFSLIRSVAPLLKCDVMGTGITGGVGDEAVSFFA